MSIERHRHYTYAQRLAALQQPVTGVTTMFGKKRYIEQTEELLSEILEIQDANAIIVRGGDCEILFASTAAQAYLKKERLKADTCGESFAKLFKGLCERCVNNEECADAQADIPFSKYDVENKDGRAIEVTTRQVTWPDKYAATALFFSDVHEIRTVESELYKLAYNDQLTGVPNRQKLIENAAAIASAKQDGKCGAVALLDLDNFKAVNDTYGHNTGDIMLKRLTEYLGSVSEFQDCLYRLGGDEFVLFMQDSAENLASEEALRKHYGEIFAYALYAYTLPNIEISCTVSMGVAFFPLHGETLSDLLRKSDIALYQSKAKGRNQLTFFENQFEAAKKFKDFYINILPIFAKNGVTYGYELSDSGDESKHGDKSINLDEFDRAIDTLGLDALNNNLRYFIAYSPRLHSASVSKNLPKEKFIVQIRLPKELTEENYAAYKALSAKGFLLLLSGLNKGNLTPRLMEMAKYARFEPGGLSEEEQAKTIEGYPRVRFIATGVNAQQDYAHAKALGFALFQGSFCDFPPPVVKKEKDVSPLKLNYFRLLKLTSTEGYVSFSQIAEIVESDVALSYMLLRLLNSAAIGLRNRVSSISMAVSLLGEENLKKWIALLSVRGVAQDKPLELVRFSLVRAQFGELLIDQMKGGPPRNKKYAFMVGMFSLLHIAMEKTKEELLAEMPVADDIRDSLLTKEGPYSDLLQFFEDYEQSNWDGVTAFSDKNHLSSQAIYESYIAAIKWYKDLSGDMD